MTAPPTPFDTGVPRAAPPVGTGVRATARIRAAVTGRVTTLPLLRGDGPFALRRLRPHDGEARVCVIGAMSAPLGGDRLAIDVTAEDRAALRVTTAAATLALPGSTTGHATYDVTLTAGEEARLRWLPKPLISAHGSNLRQTYTVDLAPTARLLLREVQILGRAGERPGRLATRLTVRRGGRPLLDQQTTVGPDAPGWEGPAVLSGHRVVGQVLVVDPAFEEAPPEAHVFGDDPADGQGALLPLAGPAALITALAPDTPRLHRILDTARNAVRGG